MAYRVIWHPDAENDMAALWLETANRNRLTAAIDRLDAAVASHPLEVGESREGNVRIAFEDELVCRFTVDDDNKIVVVRSIWCRE